jgi:hypothetical protein
MNTVTLLLEIAGPYIRIYTLGDSGQGLVLFSGLLNPPAFALPDRKHYPSADEAVVLSVHVGDKTALWKKAAFKLGLRETVQWFRDMGLDPTPFINQAHAFGWNLSCMEPEPIEEPTDE